MVKINSMGIFFSLSGPTGQAQRYENVVLPSEIGKLASPSVSFEYEGKDEVYEVMGGAHISHAHACTQS